MDNFRIQAITTHLAAKKIVIEATLDIDPDTVGYNSVKLTEKASKRIVDYTPEVKFDQLILHLDEWPTPNVEYLLKIQHVESVMGDKLPASLQRKIFFKSEIESTVDIVSPADFEKIEELTIQLREITSREEAPQVGTFYIEISVENGFYKPVVKTLMHDTSMKFMELNSGQYYARARVQDDKGYGAWSTTKTFVIESPFAEKKTPVPGKEQENGDPVFELPLFAEETPEDGTLPETFVFRFNRDIDPDMVGKIRVIKRQV